MGLVVIPAKKLVGYVIRSSEAFSDGEVYYLGKSWRGELWGPREESLLYRTHRAAKVDAYLLRRKGAAVKVVTITRKPKSYLIGEAR